MTKRNLASLLPFPFLPSLPLSLFLSLTLVDCASLSTGLELQPSRQRRFPRTPRTTDPVHLSTSPSPRFHLLQPPSNLARRFRVLLQQQSTRSKRLPGIRQQDEPVPAVQRRSGRGCGRRGRLRIQWRRARCPGSQEEEERRWRNSLGGEEGKDREGEGG